MVDFFGGMPHIEVAESAETALVKWRMVAKS
jgi:hypothetical protein